MELLILDTTKIQSYIFGSNKLQENLGASFLVAQATSKWVVEVLATELGLQVDLENLELQIPIEDKTQQPVAELLFCGGGNATIAFQNETGRRSFLRNYSRLILARAPNLQIIFAISDPFDWHTKRLTNIEQETIEQLKENKQMQPKSQPILGLGITLPCSSIGSPAIEVEEKRGISAEIRAKLDQVEPANQALKELFTTLPANTTFPFDTDDFGRSKGEFSYIGIVHADGDGLGKRFEQLNKAWQGNNRDYIQAKRALSKGIAKSSTYALQRLLGDLIATIKWKKEEEGKSIPPHIPHDPDIVLRTLDKKGHKDDGKFLLPFRPIVFGGDDLTFICDGRLAFSLTERYIQYFTEETNSLESGRASASAGIAIVKTHHPFVRSYQLSENLCKSAKKYRKQLKEEWDYESGVVDWHFGINGMVGTLEEMRKNYYVAEGKLMLRPVTLKDNPDENYRNWDQLLTVITQFQHDYLDRRNKVKELREILREGAVSVSKWLIQQPHDKNKLPKLGGKSKFEEEGWFNHYCGYFDAIELMDWFIPLKEEA